MATRADVARLAGVSPATVSYAISGKAPISEETRDRVYAAMRELQYTPNVMAQALAGRRSRIIAMLLPSQERALSNADMEYMLGAASAARELGYHLLLWPTVDRDVEEVVALGQAGLLDGVILMEVRMQDERVALLRDAKVPFSLIGRTADEHEEPLFSDRDFEGAAFTESIPFTETRDYVQAVMAYTTIYDYRLNEGKGRRLSERLPPIAPNAKKLSPDP